MGLRFVSEVIFENDRLRCKNALSPSECADPATTETYLPFDHPLVAGIVDIVHAHMPVNTAPPSYCRVERHPAAHEWHGDNARHMPWCAVSASVLLRPADSGGVFSFRDGPVDLEPGDLLAWRATKGNEHRRTAHDGSRTMLLMFLGSE